MFRLCEGRTFSGGSVAHPCRILDSRSSSPLFSILIFYLYFLITFKMILYEIGRTISHIHSRKRRCRFDRFFHIRHVDLLRPRHDPGSHLTQNKAQRLSTLQGILILYNSKIRVLTNHPFQGPTFHSYHCYHRRLFPGRSPDHLRSFI